jgi:cold shock protein
MIGKLKRYDDERGYGFIKPDDGGPNIFVHIKALERGGVDLPEVDDRLEFDTTAGRGGKPEATNIRRLESGPVRFGTCHG